MDPVSDLIRSWKIPVGKWGKSLIDFVVDYFQWLFDALKVSLNFVVEGTTAGLLMLPPVVLALLIALFAWWLRKSWKLALGVLVGLLFILNQGLWKETVQTLVLVTGATGSSTRAHDLSRHHLDPEAHDRGGRGLRRHQAAAPVEG